MGPGFRRDNSAEGPYPMTFSLRFRAAIISIALFLSSSRIWQIATRGTGRSPT